MTEILPESGPETTHHNRDVAAVLDASRRPLEAAVMERLGKTKLRDKQGFQRPIYTVHGKQILFRSPWEMPDLEDATVGLMTPEIHPPTSDEPDPYGQNIELAAIHRYVAETPTNPPDVLVITNTPEAILAAAARQTGDEGFAAEARRVNEGDYSATALGLIDDILAASTITAGGEIVTEYQPDGLALAYAALTGDADAQAILATRKHILYQKETERLKAEQAARLEHYQKYPPRAELDLNEVALVHSTTYPPERDDQGNVALKSSGSHRLVTDKYPRASLHFTINGQVSSHVFGAWDSVENTILVANLAHTMTENDKLPTSAGDVDTYFTLDPGESLVLPYPTIVHAVEEQEVLLDASEPAAITFAKRDFTADEILDIQALARRHSIKVEDNEPPVSILQKIAVAQALTAQGADWHVNPGSHYVDDSVFQEAYGKAMAEAGVGRGAIHMNLPENQVEHDAWDAVTSGAISGLTIYGDPTINSKASLAARRQVIASGLYPARPIARPPRDESLIDI